MGEKENELVESAAGKEVLENKIGKLDEELQQYNSKLTEAVGEGTAAEELKVQLEKIQGEKVILETDLQAAKQRESEFSQAAERHSVQEAELMSKLASIQG